MCESVGLWWIKSMVLGNRWRKWIQTMDNYSLLLNYSSDSSHWIRSWIRWKVTFTQTSSPFEREPSNLQFSKPCIWWPPTIRRLWKSLDPPRRTESSEGSWAHTSKLSEVEISWKMSFGAWTMETERSLNICQLKKNGPKSLISMVAEPMYKLRCSDSL